ncbi:MAG: exo-alpha-sialidase [Planctomycetia bacterium]|nr:exo-alpha-sialidase [Planctomycetia bacterium]
MRTAIVFFLVLLAISANLQAAEPTAQLVSVKKIWDQGPHNAFTDLIRFQDRWYCSFREGAGHASGAGALRVLTSADDEKWDSAALIEQKDVDLRDPKLSLMPDGRLLMVAAAAVPASRNPLKDHYSVVLTSKDAKDWSKPEKVLDSWQWLWRVTWHRGTAYGVAYQWNPKEDGTKERYGAILAKSKDGLKYEKLAELKQANATEATLAFDGDTMLCLQRRDNKPNSALLGVSKPPYTDWNWKDLGIYFGGPNFIRLKDGWWACGRIIENGKAQTVLCRLDVDAGKLTPALTLPSGGDNSYAGLAWHQDQLWISYYSSHEGKSSIYLARVETK